GGVRRSPPGLGRADDRGPSPVRRAGEAPAGHALLSDDHRHARGRVLGGDHGREAGCRRASSRSGACRSSPAGRPMSALPLGSRPRVHRIQVYLFTAPSALILAGVALVPIALAVWLSSQRMIIVFHEQSFVGWDNYRFLLRDPRFWAALGNTA